jgi:hypothetical protein
MPNYLVNLFKSAPKGDSFRTDADPDKYTNSITALNASGANKNGTPPVKVGASLPKTPAPTGNPKLP